MSKLVLRIMGEKVIGQADDNEKEKLIRIIAEDIASIESTLSIEQIIKILRETKMYFMEKLPVMNGAAGCSIGKDIYVDIGFLEYLNNDDILEEIRSDPEYKTVVHECIHRIQNNYGRIYPEVRYPPSALNAQKRIFSQKKPWPFLPLHYVSKETNL